MPARGQADTGAKSGKHRVSHFLLGYKPKRIFSRKAGTKKKKKKNQYSYSLSDTSCVYSDGNKRSTETFRYLLHDPRSLFMLPVCWCPYP